MDERFMRSYELNTNLVSRLQSRRFPGAKDREAKIVHERVLGSSQPLSSLAECQTTHSGYKIGKKYRGDCPYLEVRSEYRTS